MQVFHWLHHSGGVAVLPEGYKQQLQETLATGDIATSFANDEEYRGGPSAYLITKAQGVRKPANATLIIIIRASNDMPPYLQVMLASRRGCRSP